jgi:NADH-quinone oxidoreductase subunit D
MANTEIMTVNMGPQHPSTHGVLQLVIELDGETVVKVDPVIGYLHRGVEKLSEYRTYHQTLPLTDRMDYLAPMANNLGYILTVEKLLGIDVPERARVIRVIMNEMARLQSHLVWLATHALDIGAMTVFIYAFREREAIMETYELISGARMTSNFFRAGGLSQDVPPEFEKKVRDFVTTLPGYLDMYEGLLTNNPIWRKRTIGNGVISAEDATDIGITGPALRGSGVDFDLRRDIPYCGYEKYKFSVPTGTNCDTYDRYKVRLLEMRESCKIIEQALAELKPGPVLADAPQVCYPPKESVYNSIEGLIHHFKIASEGYPVPEGEVFLSIENPKGELGYYIVSDGGNKPYRMRVRPPSFVNLQAIEQMSKGAMISDLVAVIGTLDVVLGEIDR